MQQREESGRMMEIREPNGTKELEEAYELRWKILRMPWKQPKGSERDGLDGRDDVTWNVVAVENATVVGTGRLHRTGDHEGQVRFMCVEEEHTHKGIGRAMLGHLHEKARQVGMRRILANVRENAAGFYVRHGYVAIGKARTLFGQIRHVRMRKDLGPE